jgi:hypothetical protein
VRREKLLLQENIGVSTSNIPRGSKRRVHYHAAKLELNWSISISGVPCSPKEDRNLLVCLKLNITYFMELNYS